jgi:hypothetical protein
MAECEISELRPCLYSARTLALRRKLMAGFPPPMSLLDRLERVLGRYAIPNITLYIVMGQVFVLLGWILGRLDLSYFLLVPERVLQGEWWRVFSFIFMPPPIARPDPLRLVFVAFALYIFYFMGNALEGYWGTFRYNAFLFIGVMLTIGAAFLTPGAASTNTFLAGSVFLAFAYLHPDFELSLFFLLPIKVKWLALVTWILYGVTFIRGDWPVRFQVLASVGNFMLFFGRDIALSMRQRRRRIIREASRVAPAEREARHVCHVCGKTDVSHPQLDFRYCSKCAGDQCYCPEHIQNHAHVVAADEGKAV